MSKAELLPLPYDVNKANELIRNKVTLNNVIASRIFAHFVSMIKPTDTNFHEYEIFAIEILQGEHGGKNYKEIREAVRTLVKTCVFERLLPTFSDLGQDYEFIPVFSSIGYRKNKVFCSFNDKMKPYLLELKANYTKYNLIEYLKLPSIYSQKLFELLKSWEKIQQGEVILTLDELYRIIDVPKSYTYKDFKLRVLNKAHKDIHAKTSLKYEWKPIKQGRSFTHIRFIFSHGKTVHAIKEKEKETQDTNNKKTKELYTMAIICASEKKGICIKQDNKKKVCALCVELNFCDSIAKRNRQGSLCDTTC